MDLVELLDCKFGKIECLHHTTTNDGFDLLFIGTQDGMVVSYKIQREINISKTSLNKGEETLVCTLMKDLNLKKTRRVEKIETDPTLNLCFIQFNGQLDAYDLYSLEHIQKIQEKNVSVFCRDRQNTCRLCVCVKKKLLIIHYTRDASTIFEEKFIPEPVGLDQLEFYGNSIIIGLKKEYIIIQTNVKDIGKSFKAQSSRSLASSFSLSGTILDTDDNGGDDVIHLTQVSDNIRPCVLNMGEEAIMKLSNCGAFVDLKSGLPSPRASIAWSNTPDQMTICFPFIVGLIKPNILEIYNVYDKNILKTETLKHQQSNPHIILCSSYNSKRGIFLSNNNKIFVLSPKSYDTQVDSLLNSLRINEAFELFENAFEGAMVDQEVKLQELYEKAGMVLLNKGLEITLSFRHYFPKAMKRMDARRLLSEFYGPKDPLLIFGGNSAILPSDSNKKNQTLKQKFMEILYKRSEAKMKKKITPSSTPQKVNPTISYPDDIIKKASELFNEAKKYLKEFLQVRRKYLLEQLPSGKTTTETNEIEELIEIDTSLIRLYLENDNNDDDDDEEKMNMEKLEKLFYEKNYCDTKRVELMFKTVSLPKLIYLAVFFASRRRYAEAFSHLFQYRDNKIAQLQAIILLKQLTSKYAELSKEEEELIWKYSVWVMLEAPLDTILIFETNQIPYKKVLQFLKETPEFTNIAENKQDLLLLMYLEYVVVKQKIADQQWHTQLAFKYIENIMQYKHQRNEHEIKFVLKPNTLSDSERGEKLLLERPFIHDMRDKLCQHLLISSHCDYQMILEKLKNTLLLEEISTVYKKLRHHEAALSVIMYDLQQIEAAEKYCLGFADPKKPIHSQNYLTNPELSEALVKMIKLCFEGPIQTSNLTNHTPKVDKRLMRFGLECVNKYAKIMDPIKAIHFLPNDLPCNLVEPFLRQSVLESTSNQRHHMIVKNVAKQENAEMSFQLRCLYQNRKLTISKRLRCKVCHKNIGNMVFAVYPDRTIVHYSCIHKSIPTSSSTSNISPSTITTSTTTSSLTSTSLISTKMGQSETYSNLSPSNLSTSLGTTNSTIQSGVPIEGNLQYHPITNRNFRLEPLILENRYKLK